MSITLNMPIPPSLNKLWISIPGKKRVRSPEYSSWLRTAGWELRRQLVGMAPISCRYDLEIHVPVSRRDTGNWEKPISDVLQAAGAVTNDGNANAIIIKPTDRSDVCVCIVPLPAMGNVRSPSRILPSRGGYRARPRKKGITTTMQLGWR